MATKQGLERLLKKGTVTGREAARLILQDSVEVDHGREGFLSQKEIHQITNSLSPAEGREYNRWLDVYRTLAYFIKDGEIIAWNTAFQLERGMFFLHEYMTDYSVRQAQAHVPRIVTEKEYQWLKERQRKELLEEYHCLDEVISDRAHELAPEEVRKQCDVEDIHVADAHPELFEEAEKQIMELIESGKLQTVKLEHKANEKNLPSYIYAWRVTTDECTPEREELLLQTYISGDVLYASGLPEWQEWIDEFKPGLKHGEEAMRYAVIQEPYAFEQDEQGHYKGRDWLSSLAMLEELDNRFKQSGKEGLGGFLKRQHDIVKTQIQRFLAGKSVVDTVSQILGVKFGEELEERYQHLLSMVDIYNSFVEWSTTTSEYYKGPRHKLQIIHLEKLKPNARELKNLREQLAGSLGEEWWLETVNDWLIQKQDLQEDMPQAPLEAEEEVASGQE